MNSGSFQKGVLKRNQGKHGPPKSVVAARAAIGRFLDSNADRMQLWLDEIAERDGPRAAMQCYARLLEFHVPKRARHEAASDAGPVEIVIRWADAG